MPPALVPFLLGYAVGSVPMAWLLVRLATRQDVSQEGSGNVGALNASRVAKSKWVGVGVMALDALKGAAAVWLAVWWQGGWAFTALAAAALGAIAGHNYNLWLSLAHRRLVGGKGYAAAAGAALVFRPWLVVAWLATTLVLFVLLRKTRAIDDEAPASALSTIAMGGFGLLLYDVPTAWFGLGVALLCVPKVLPELPAVFAEAKALREAQALDEAKDA